MEPGAGPAGDGDEEEGEEGAAGGGVPREEGGVPHGAAAEYAKALVPAGKRVIDLSADFRIADLATYEKYYGKHHAPELLGSARFVLPELTAPAWKTEAKLVAAPGCYPTSILLPLVPALKAGLVAREHIVANSFSGVSGAGRNAKTDYLFVECNESVRAYSIPKHRHLAEIEQELRRDVTFVPHLVPLDRGILETIYVPVAPGTTEADVARVLAAAYQSSPFVRLTGGTLPEIKQVAYTNFCDIGWKVDDARPRAVLVAVLDNLLKGAAGQAVQNLNLMLGLDERTGMR